MWGDTDRQVGRLAELGANDPGSLADKGFEGSSGSATLQPLSVRTSAETEGFSASRSGLPVSVSVNGQKGHRPPPLHSVTRALWTVGVRLVSARLGSTAGVVLDSSATAEGAPSQRLDSASCHTAERPALVGG